MKFKNLLTILVLILILASAVNTIYASEDREYKITSAVIDLTVQENGLLHVQESYNYRFDGTFNGVYRDIPIKSGQNIENLHVETDGAYSTYNIENQGDNLHLVVYLWADEAHTQKISDRNVRVTYSYDMVNVVTVFNDIVSLQYKLWGENWDVGVGSITANIHLPGNTSNTYYLNPPYFNKSSSLNGNTIHAVTSHIPSGDFYELQVLMPLSDFPNATYATHINSPGKAQIEQNQAEYANSINFWGNVFTVFAMLCFISPLVPIIIYLIYGREPKVNYNGIYERELPSDDPPSVVNALIQNKRSIGKPNMNGFEASIMDLINRKIFEITVGENEHTNDLFLKLNQDRYDELNKCDRITFNIMNRFSVNNILNMSELSSKLSNETNGKWFANNFDLWKKTVANEYLNKKELSWYFNRTGTELSMIFGLLGLIFAFILFIISILSYHPSSDMALWGSIFLGIVSLITIFLPDDIFGQWTKNGRVYYLKWNNFKKFLKDNSLIEEHPPESIVIWNNYLVYGTALGVADSVYKAMKLYVPHVSDDDYYYYDLYTFHRYSGLIMLSSAFNTGIHASNASNSGGSFGNVGGGSGGGGGGAF